MKFKLWILKIRTIIFFFLLLSVFSLTSTVKAQNDQLVISADSCIFSVSSAYYSTYSASGGLYGNLKYIAVEKNQAGTGRTIREDLFARCQQKKIKGESDISCLELEYFTTEKSVFFGTKRIIMSDKSVGCFGANEYSFVKGGKLGTLLGICPGCEYPFRDKDLQEVLNQYFKPAGKGLYYRTEQNKKDFSLLSYKNNPFSDYKLTVILRCDKGSLSFQGAYKDADPQGVCSQVEVEPRGDTLFVKPNPELEEEGKGLRSVMLENCGDPDPSSGITQCCNPREIEENILLESKKKLSFAYKIPIVGKEVEKAFGSLSSLEKDFSLDDNSQKIYTSDYYCGKNSYPAWLDKDGVYKPFLDLQNVDLSICECVKGELGKTVQNYDITEVCGVLPSAEDRDNCVSNIISCDGVYTALGCVEYSLEGFINNVLFKVGLSIAGIFTFLCILYGAFLITIAQGNVDQVKKAQDMIKNCILGLLFIIFSVFILNIASLLIFGINIFA